MAGKQADIKVGVVTNYDDKGIKQAKTGLAGFNQSIADADGVGNKFKAGWSSITDSVKANAGAMAVGAGTALIAFGAKAVGAFTETAKAALDLGTATGLSTEQASRWIAVADDMGVSAESLQVGLGKIGKTLDGEQWSKYGIATRDAGGAARDTNDILLDSFDMLGNIGNETERVRVGNELFGKGYASLSPLIGKTRKEMETYLGTVEDGQVITDQEAEKAEKFRLAQDQLGDAVKEVTIAIGAQIAGLAPLIGLVVKFIEVTTKAWGPGGITPDTSVLDTLYAMRAEADKGGRSWESYWEEVQDGKLTLSDAITQIHDAAAAAAALEGTLHDGERSWETQTEWLEKAAEGYAETDRETRRLTEGMEGGTEAFRGALRPVQNMVGAVDNLKEKFAEANIAYRELIGDISEEEAWENVVVAIDEFGNGVKATAQEVRDIKRDIADYVAETETIPENKKTEIYAALREGDIAEAERLLAELTRTRAIYLTLTGPGAVTAAGYSKDDQFASGGMVGGPKGAPRQILAHGGEVVLNGQQQSALLNGGVGGGGNTYIINVEAGVDGYLAGRRIAASLDELQRRSGRR